MSRNAVFVTILIGAVVMTAACTSKGRLSDVDSWRTNTLKMAAASAKGGPFSEAPSGMVAAPTPYATYYALKTLQMLGTDVAVDHQQATAKWLKSLTQSGRFVSGDQSGDDIGEMFYGLTTISTIQADIPAKTAFAGSVHQLQFATGPYAFSRKHQQSLTTPPQAKDALLSTYEALQILQLLGEPPKRQPELVKWLQEQWDATVADRSGDPITTPLSMLAACLQMVAPADPRLETAWSTIHSNLDVELQQPGQFHDFLLMDAAAAIDVAERMKVPPGWIPKHLVVALEQNQNADGGFNAFLNGDSDHLGTYLATKVLRYSNHIEPHRQRIASLIDLNRVPGGGYFAMSSRPVSLAATRGVAQTSRYLRIPLDKSQLTQYLAGVLQEEATPANVHVALDTARLSGIDLPVTDAIQDHLIQLTDIRSVPGSMQELESLYHTVLALKLTHTPIPAERRQLITRLLDQMRNSDGGYGVDGKSTLDTTTRITIILRAIEAEPTDRASLVRWLQGRQKGGFADEGKPAQLGVTYLALQALNALGEQPSRSEEVRRWIAACLKPEGGAGFAPPGTVADAGVDGGALMWTGLAIRSLELTGLDPLTDDALRGLLK